MTIGRAFLVAVILLVEARAGAGAFDTKTADFAITFNGETSVCDTAAFVLPRSSMTIAAVGGPPGDYVLTAKSGTVVQQGPRTWRYTAPAQPGDYTVSIDGPARKKDTIALRVFVMVPATQVRNGMLNGYRIGEYPATPLKGNPIYKPPAGFVEVTRANKDTKLSPHFTLEQFLCKQDEEKAFPKYVVLSDRLPLKLEAILERVNKLGFDVDTLHVMSAYRTPYYNRAIGDVQYSMHQWGSASDIYIDPHNRDKMEDLNRDGQVDIRDAKFLYDAIERMSAEGSFKKFEGGLGFYPATSAHPPFVHVDVRGTKARWKG